MTKYQDLPKFQFSGVGGVILKLNVTKCQDLPKFQLGGGGYSETEKSQSAKICLNFNFSGWGGILKLKSDKVPRSA